MFFYEKPNEEPFLSMTEKEMLLGFLANDDAPKAKNLILVYFKMNVYQCKMLNFLPNVVGARKYITYKHNIDKETIREVQ